MTKRIFMIGLTLFLFDCASVYACPAGQTCPAGKDCVSDPTQCVAASSSSSGSSSDPTTTKDQLGLTYSQEPSPFGMGAAMVDTSREFFQAFEEGAQDFLRGLADFPTYQMDAQYAEPPSLEGGMWDIPQDAFVQ